MLVVVKIHNMELIRCYIVDSWNEGESLIYEMINEQEYVLSQSDKDKIQNSGEYYNDDDPDNHYTFAIHAPNQI
jgi:hypothetical protein